MTKFYKNPIRLSCIKWEKRCVNYGVLFGIGAADFVYLAQICPNCGVFALKIKQIAFGKYVLAMGL